MPIFAQMTQSIPTMGSMPSLSLAAISPVFTNMLVGVFLMICIVMILLVLIQRPQGGGLSGAFGSGGGGGAGQTAFGTKTGDVLTWATIAIFVAFVSFAIILNFATRPADPASNIQTITVPAGAGSSTGEDGESEESKAFDLSGNPLDLIDASNEAVDGAADDATGEQGDADAAAGEAVEDQPAEPTDIPAQDD